MSSVGHTSSAPKQRLSVDFWKFWTGQTLSNLGSSITMFALPLLVFKLTGSALNLGITTAAEYIPYLLFGLVLGALMDRVNRKRAMIVADVGRATVIASIPVAATAGILTVWWIYAVGFLTSIFTICFEAGQFAAIPSLVSTDDLVTANGRVQASYSGASIIGPLLAGLLITVLPVATMLYLDALSFLVSVGSLVLIRVSFNAIEPHERRSIGQDVLEGLRYVLGHPVLRNISIMMALVNFFGSTAYAQIVLFAERQLHARDAQVALLYSGGSLGIVALSLSAGLLRKRWSFSQVALGALMAGGIVTVAFAVTPVFWLALPLWSLQTGLGILFNINTSSLRQAIVPNYLLGRVLSIAGVLAWSAIPLGTLLGGFVIQQTQNVALVYGIIGAVTLVLPIIFAFTPLGHAERYIPRAHDGDGSETQEAAAVEQVAPTA